MDDAYSFMTRYVNDNVEWFPTEAEARSALHASEPNVPVGNFSPLEVVKWRADHRLPVARCPHPGMRLCAYGLYSPRQRYAR